MRKLIAKLDIPVRQVLIEARIVEATTPSPRTWACASATTIPAVRDRSAALNRRIGHDVTDASELHCRLATRQPGSRSVQPTTRTSTCLPRAWTGQCRHVRDQPVQRQLRPASSTWRYPRWRPDGKGKIISSPRVLTADKVEALIEQGTELPYQQATSSGCHRRVVPQGEPRAQGQAADHARRQHHHDAGRQQGFSGPGDRPSAGFAIDTKHVKTEVLVENGGTVVIGGIYTQNDRNATTKVPFFGDLPVLGYLFRNNRARMTRPNCWCSSRRASSRTHFGAALELRRATGWLCAGRGVGLPLPRRGGGGATMTL